RPPRGRPARPRPPIPRPRADPWRQHRICQLPQSMRGYPHDTAVISQLSNLSGADHSAIAEFLERPMLFTQGTVALVTGGSRGIGRAVALDLAREGAHVIVNYARSEQDAKEVVSLIEEEGGSAESVRADVTDEDAVREVFRGIRAAHG